MIKEITKQEFEERYPEISTYGLDAPIFLENGVILSESNWNGELYEAGDNYYRPMQKPVDDDWETISYECMSIKNN